MIKNKPKFYWNEEKGESTCILTNGNYKYVGTAICHTDDLDMKSEKTGNEIALNRASLEALRARREELKAGLAALNHLYYCMNHSKRFNEKSYENRMLQRQINLYKNDLAATREMIASQEQNIIDYIAEKEKFYKHIRKNRAKAEND